MPYTSDWKPVKNPKFRCFKCQSNDVEYIEWESSDGGHEDNKYHCKGCDYSWWVEGSDY